ncbi:MAG: hypothetical protein H6747_04865, partial [Deltaproteobacteria bacterium]|nr:hypothetical protein [Deltaproteobacteria bacterium]
GSKLADTLVPPGSGYDKARFLCVDASFGSPPYVAGGYRSGTSGKFGWVGRFDAKLAVTATHAVGDLEVVGGISLVSKGEVVVAGELPSSAGVALLRLSQSGQTVWKKTVSTGKDDSVGGLVTMLDGSHYVAGGFAAGSGSLLLAKVDKNGDLGWSVAPGTHPGQALGIAVINNALLVAGRFEGANDEGRLWRVQVASGAVTEVKDAARDPLRDDQISHATQLLGGGIIVVGEVANSSKNTDGLLLRTDENAALDCGCKSSYSDGNGCTEDFCYLGAEQTVPGKQDATCSLDGKTGTCTLTGACAAGKVHPCDELGMCGSSVKHPVYGCYCDSSCSKTAYQDCCSAAGAKSKSCSGASCGVCQ